MSRHAGGARARPQRRGSRLAAWVTVLLLMGGAGGLGIGYADWRAASASAPAPGRVAPSASRPAGPQPTPSARPPGGLVLARSVPVRLDVSAIGLHTSLMRLGLNADRTVEVPPIAKDSPAGWYQFSPTPGQLGPSVILGHVTLGQFGDGVFFRLSDLRAGDRVDVSRADGSVAVFSVDRTAEYPKSAFPAQAVYGNIDHAGLRLITCGGTRNQTTHTYSDNVVVYASLISAAQSASADQATAPTA